MGAIREREGGAATRARGGRAASRALGPQGERTRRRLLDAAKGAFSERGYSATRVDDITRAAGTSHGAFYLYFPNKQEILQTLVQENTARMIALAGRLDTIEPGEHGYQILRDWVADFIEAYGDDASVVIAWTQAADDPRFDRLGRDVLRAVSGKISEAIERDGSGVDRGTFDPAIAATALVAMIERLCYFWLIRSGRFPPEAAVDTLAAISYMVIFGNAPG